MSVVPPFLPASRTKLTRRDRGRFAGTTLFDALGRAVCEAECLPRRELYESWEVARRVRRRFRGGRGYPRRRLLVLAAPRANREGVRDSQRDRREMVRTFSLLSTDQF